MNKESRRKTLKALAVGAPVVWAKPVVDSVVLPAHGRSSLNCECVSFDVFYVRYFPGTFPVGEVGLYSDSGCTNLGSMFPAVEANDIGQAETRYENLISNCSSQMSSFDNITCANVWTCASNTP